jgi:serine/threonine protein phosphatase PrpC
VGFAGPEAYGEASRPWDPASDRLLLFTDGLSDTLTSAEHPNGDRLVLDTVRARMSADPSEVVDELFHLTRDARPTVPSDDRTAVVVAGA